MHLARRCQRLSKLITPTTRNASKSSIADGERIEIPNRIQRTSTDILYALSSTVGRDPTAPHYKYHDDPYLIPPTNVSKKTYAMAQESGRKAAKWIKEQHKDFFMHQEAQPPIKDFAPKMVYTEESEVDEQVLRQLIQQSEVNDAVLVYNLLNQKGTAISNELKQSFLELLCFYNHDQPLPEEDIEERWFTRNVEMRERNRKTWKDGELAEQLFAEIEPKTVATYAALIRGMAKYHQAERAFALLQEANEKQFELDTTTFNAILSNVNFLRENADQRWNLCQELLQQMAQQEIKPDLGTLNALMETISSFGNFKFARSCALKTLAEFKLLGIAPSLGTYYFLLIVFCRERGPVSHVIVDILRELEGKEFTIQHPKDTFFFTTAMDVCRNHLHDKSLARKVNTLLHTGNNYNLIGDSYMEGVYYRHFFALLCATEPIEEFMQLYEQLVPNIYIPEPGVMEEVLKSIEMHGASDLMPRIWSDMVIFDNTSRESLLTRALQIMLNNPANIEVPSQQQLPEQFAQVALDVFNKVNESQSSRMRKMAFTGQMIGDILTLIVRGGNFEKAVEVFTYIDKNQHRIPGTPSEICLAEFIDCCIENKAPTQAILCLQYAVENSMDGHVLAEKINAGFTLNEIHLSKIKSLVGDDFLKAKATAKQ